jgi:hypothetical protein
MTTATANATAAGLSKPTEIKGIPVAMLDSTGSIPAATEPSSGANGLSSLSSSSDLRKAASKNTSAVNLAKQSALLNHQHHQPQQPTQAQSHTPSQQQNLQQYPNASLSYTVTQQHPIISNTPTQGGFESNQFVPYDLENFTGTPENRDRIASNTPGAAGNNNLEFDLNSTAATNDGLSRTDFDSFFQQQSAGWMEGNDDVLGWFDINMAPEF